MQQQADANAGHHPTATPSQQVGIPIEQGSLSEPLWPSEHPKEYDRLLLAFRDLQARYAELSHTVERLQFVAGKALPVYLANDYRPLATPQRGETTDRILICSIPKAGTYFYARLLELLGVVPTNLHLAMGQIEDFRFYRTMGEARRGRHMGQVPMPIEEALKLVEPGQFAVGHLECSWNTVGLFSGFKVLFLYRNIRDVVVSYMRWLAATGWETSSIEKWRTLPDTPEKVLRFLDDVGSSLFYCRCYPLLGWFRRPGVLSVSFEQLRGDFGREMQVHTIAQVSRFCGTDWDFLHADRILQQLVDQPTLTWSGCRSRWKSMWSEEVESRFVELGGKNLNRRLGYEGD